MTDAIQGKLEQAYDLIRQERFEDAQETLRPIIFSNPSADAWWLWANAVTEPEDARHALGKVLELDPEHTQAQEFLARLNAFYPEVPEAETETFEFGQAEDFDELYEDASAQAQVEADILDVLPPETEPVVEPYRAADVSYDDDFAADIRQLDMATEAEAVDTGSEALDFSNWLEDLAEEESAPEKPAVTAEPEKIQKAPRSNLLRNILFALILIVVGVAAGLLLLNLNTGTQPTDQAALPLPSAELQSIVEAAQTAAMAEASALGGEPEVQVVSYNNAPAMVVQVCRGAGPDLSTALDTAMSLAARYGISAQDELDYVGAHLKNCTRDDSLVASYATIEDAAAFAGGVLSAADFQSTWTLNP